MYRASGSDPDEQFVDQFQADGSDYLYRYRMAGPAYRVTADEKYALTAAFRQWRRWIFGIFVVAYVGYGIALFAIASFEDRWVDDVLGKGWHSFIPFSFFIALQLADYLIADRAPLWVLRHRTPIAPRLPNAERRRIALERVSTNNLIGIIMLGVVVLFVSALTGAPTAFGGRFMLAACAGLLVWATVQSARKWLLRRADYAANNLI